MSTPNTTYYKIVGNGINLEAVQFVSNKKYTFHEPQWFHSNEVLKTLELRYPSFDVETMFLMAPFRDVVDGAVQNLQYWKDRKYLKYDDLGQVQQGFMPSFLDENTLSLSNIKISENTFIAPKFLPVFFLVNNIKGKNQVDWTLYDDTDPDNRIKVIKIRGISYFVFRFNEVGTYSLTAEVRDNTGGIHSGDAISIIRVVEKDEYISIIESLLDTRKSESLNK